jgi:hypothetical protein
MTYVSKRYFFFLEELTPTGSNFFSLFVDVIFDFLVQLPPETFALNAFLVSIRFAQFFKLSRELKFVWRGIKTSISNVCRFVLYLLLPCLFISVSSAFVIFGPHVLSM